MKILNEVFSEKLFSESIKKPDPLIFYAEIEYCDNINITQKDTFSIIYQITDLHTNSFILASIDEYKKINFLATIKIKIYRDFIKILNDEKSVTQRIRQYLSTLLHLDLILC